MTTVASFNQTPVLRGDDHTLKVRMSESVLANLQTYPLYNMITEQIKTPADKEILSEGLHEMCVVDATPFIKGKAVTTY